MKRVAEAGSTALSVSPSAGTGWRKIVEKRTEGIARRVQMKIGGGALGLAQSGSAAGGRKAGMDITWVTDRIAVGGGIWNGENMAAVSRAGITHIIDMQIEFDDSPLAEPHGITVCWNPIDDDFELKPPAVFARGVEFALAALNDDGAKLFVHCAAGVHRAPMMALALLGAMGWTLDDAMDLIEGRRPAADFADVYVRSVKNFLKGRESVKLAK
jgi:protein-tyrosine phosphatase